MSKPVSKIIFDKFDADNSGFIDSDEFGQMLISQGIYMSEEAVQAALKQIDRNGDKRISYEEFLNWKKTSSFDSFTQDQDNMDILVMCAEAFDRYDTNNDGALDYAELRVLHADVIALGIWPADAGVDDLLNDMDADGDRLTTYLEFINWMRKQGMLGQ